MFINKIDYNEAFVRLTLSSKWFFDEFLEFLLKFIL